MDGVRVEADGEFVHGASSQEHIQRRSPPKFDAPMESMTRAAAPPGAL